MGQPEFVHVLCFGGLRRVTGVHMQVDETRQYVHAGGIDFLRGLARRIGRAHVAGDVLGLHDGGNAIALDHDVHGTACRRARTIDHRRMANHESVEGTFALGPRRGRPRIGGFVLSQCARHPASERQGCQSQHGPGGVHPFFFHLHHPRGCAWA